MSASSKGASSVSKYDWIACAMLAALAPLMLIHFQNLWARQHFQFFPVAWGVFAYLAWQVPWTTTPSRLRRYVAFGSWIAAIVFLGMAIATFSPWLSHVAFLASIIGWALLRLGTRSWLTVMLWCGLIAITVPLPGNADETLIQNLQAVSTSSASNLLDAFRVPHLARGNILNVRGQELFVDEACSGVGSLYALTAVALMLIGMRESQRAIFSILLLCSVPFWAWLGNVIRLTVIAYVLHQFGVDLTHGWQHTMLGLLVFAGSFVCLIAFTKLLEELLMPLRTNFKSSQSKSRSKFDKLVNWPANPNMKGKMAPPESTPLVNGLIGISALPRRSFDSANIGCGTLERLEMAATKLHGCCHCRDIQGKEPARFRQRL